MRKPVIGLTGPTGAGKSTVAGALRKLGCAVIDADRVAREVTDRPECREKLRNSFGKDIVCPDGSLNRGLLAERAFSSPEKTQLLNHITHPAVLKEFTRRMEAEEQSGARAVILDVPLLFESGADSLCDTTVAVITPAESRRKRIMARDGITGEQARKRMDAQHGETYYSGRAAYIFDGSTPLDAFDGAVAALLDTDFEEINETH